MEFEERYYRPSNRAPRENIHMQVSPNVLMYMGTYNPLSRRGQNFTIEKIDESGKLVSKLSAMSVMYDTAIHKWTALNYYIRQINGNEETITSGTRIDTTLTLNPSDLSRDPGIVNTMTYNQLNSFIRQLRLQGSEELKFFLIEKHKRFSNPFAVFILTLIGVSLSSRKIRGGLGMNIGIGLILSFSYILFLQFSSQFSLKGNLGPMLAMWIPNILYSIIAIVLYKMAPK